MIEHPTKPSSIKEVIQFILLGVIVLAVLWVLWITIAK